MGNCAAKEKCTNCVNYVADCIAAVPQVPPLMPRVELSKAKSEAVMAGTEGIENPFYIQAVVVLNEKHCDPVVEPASTPSSWVKIEKYKRYGWTGNYYEDFWNNRCKDGTIPAIVCCPAGMQPKAEVLSAGYFIRIRDGAGYLSPYM